MSEDALLARFNVRHRRPRHRRLKPATDLLLREAKGHATLEKPLAEDEVEFLDGGRHEL